MTTAGAIRLKERDRAQAAGGMKVVHEGWNGRGKWCTVYVAPNGGKGFDAAKSRICTDVETRLPAKVEAYEADGTLKEQYEFTNVQATQHPAKFFESSEF